MPKGEVLSVVAVVITSHQTNWVVGTSEIVCQEKKTDINKVASMVHNACWPGGGGGEGLEVFQALWIPKTPSKGMNLVQKTCITCTVPLQSYNLQTFIHQNYFMIQDCKNILCNQNFLLHGIEHDLLGAQVTPASS